MNLAQDPDPRAGFATLELPARASSPTMRPVGDKRRTPEGPEARKRRAIEKAARRRANRRIFLLGHCIVWVLVVALLVVTAGPFPALVVGLSWGVFVALQGFFFVVAPELKRRWVAAELEPRVQQAVVDERRLVSGRHTRTLEATTAQLAHEIRNPITAAKSLVQQIAEDPGSDESAEYAKVAVEELDRVERSISHVLRFAREEPVELEATSLSEAVRAGLETLRDRATRSHVVIEHDADDGERLLGDPDKLRRIVINLVGNAIEALSDSASADRRVWVSTGQSPSGTEVWLRVKDSGPGISSERLEKIFTPFYTSKRDGTGLGLAITKKLVDAHGGSIEVESEVGRGTEFSVRFPKLGRDPDESDS